MRADRGSTRSASARPTAARNVNGRGRARTADPSRVKRGRESRALPLHRCTAVFEARALIGVRGRKTARSHASCTYCSTHGDPLPLPGQEGPGVGRSGPGKAADRRRGLASLPEVDVPHPAVPGVRVGTQHLQRDRRRDPRAGHRQRPLRDGRDPGRGQLVDLAGKRLADPQAVSEFGYTDGLNTYPPIVADRAPDSQTGGKPSDVVPCAQQATPTTPQPAAAPAHAAAAPRLKLEVVIGRLSARKISKRGSLSIGLRAGEKTSALRARLKRGKRLVAAGRLTSISGNARGAGTARRAHCRRCRVRQTAAPGDETPSAPVDRLAHAIRLSTATPPGP